MQQTSSIWIADDDPSIIWVLKKALEAHAYEVREFSEARTLIDALNASEAEARPDVVITDIRMPGMSGLAMLKRLHRVDARLPVIVMTAYSDLQSAVSSYQAGAFDYLPKPFDVDDALNLVSKALRHHGQRDTSPASGVKDVIPARNTDETSTRAAKSETETPAGLGGMIGHAPAMQEVFQAIGRLSKSNISVLIRGESGTGKELVARALHQSSPRVRQPFLEINTAAIPADLLESELFGHEKGAFTGADERRIGRFEQAHGGTLFLDEIGDMPAELQTRLLRVLSESRFFRVGGHEELTVDVRIIAATNQDLDARVQDGRFRLDLFHRLNVVTIEIPPLRERLEDIPPLTRFFFAQAAKEFQLEEKKMDDAAMRTLQAHHWSGNVRELQNLCQRLSVMVPGESVTVHDLPPEFRHVAPTPANTISWKEHLSQAIRARFLRGEQAVMDQLQPEIDQVLIDTALAFSEGHKQNAAKLLGWGRNTLTRKTQELDKLPSQSDRT